VGIKFQQNSTSNNLVHAIKLRPHYSAGRNLLESTEALMIPGFWQLRGKYYRAVGKAENKMVGQKALQPTFL
jgi:hypothetical protein